MPSDFAPRSDCSLGDPRSMVPVRLAGAEVTGAFWASAAGDYCGCARRGNSLVGLRFPERITQIANAAEVLTFVVDRHPEPRIVLQSEFVAVVANERAARIDMAPWRNHLDENPNSSGCQRPIQPDDLRVAACFASGAGLAAKIRLRCHLGSTDVQRGTSRRKGVLLIPASILAPRRLAN